MDRPHPGVLSPTVAWVRISIVWGFVAFWGLAMIPTTIAVSNMTETTDQRLLDQAENMAETFEDSFSGLVDQFTYLVQTADVDVDVVRD